jgi:hypothetical protein
MAASPGIAKPSSAHGRETEARLRIGGGVRTILLLPQQHLCDYARGERPEYRQVARAAVGLESLGRRQFSFIGPPEPMLFYKLPGLFHLTPPYSSAALVYLGFSRVGQGRLRKVWCGLNCAHHCANDRDVCNPSEVLSAPLGQPRGRVFY